MEATRKAVETVNTKTGMTHSEAREFVRNHFEEFVNRKNVEIGRVNFAPGFLDHGADVPRGLPPGGLQLGSSSSAGPTWSRPTRPDGSCTREAVLQELW